MWKFTYSIIEKRFLVTYFAHCCVTDTNLFQFRLRHPVFGPIFSILFLFKIKNIVLLLLFFRYQQHVPVTYKHVNKNNEQFLEMVPRYR